VSFRIVRVQQAQEIAVDVLLICSADHDTRQVQRTKVLEGLCREPLNRKKAFLVRAVVPALMCDASAFGGETDRLTDVRFHLETDKREHWTSGTARVSGAMWQLVSLQRAHYPAGVRRSDQAQCSWEACAEKRCPSAEPSTPTHAARPPTSQ
jgi:hypothetical protein